MRIIFFDYMPTPSIIHRLLLTGSIALRILIGTLPTSAQPPQAFRSWYVIFTWEGSSGTSRGADILTIHTDGSLEFQSKQRKVIGHWIYDSTTQRFSAIVANTRYSLGVGDSSIYGTMTVGEEKGYIDGQAAPFGGWATLMELRRTNDSQRAKPRLSIEHTSLPRESSALQFGILSAPMRTGFNGEFASLRMFKQGATTYISSNSIFAVLSLGGFLVLKACDVPEKYHLVAAAPTLLYMITNFDVSIPISGSTWCLDIAQSTDYYFFYKISRIVTESRVGLLIDLQSKGIPMQLSAMYCQPWFKGYRDNTDSYLAGRIGWVFR